MMALKWRHTQDTTKTHDVFVDEPIAIATGEETKTDMILAQNAQKSLQWTPFKPFKFIGIDYTLIQLSKYHQALITSFVGLWLHVCRPFGYFVFGYFCIFTDPDTSSACQWEGDASIRHLKYLLSSGHWSSRCRSPRHWIK
eukprot:727171_1